MSTIETSRRGFLRSGVAVGSAIAVSSLSGCSGNDGGDGADGGDGSDDGDSTPDATTSEPSAPDGDGSNETEDGTSGEEETPVDLASPLAPGEYEFVEFGAPVTLEYETFTKSGGAGTLVVEVTDVEGDTATFDLQYTRGDVQETTTISGDFGEIYRGTYTAEADQLFSRLFASRSVNHHNQRLDVGAEWTTRTGIPGENIITVTGTDSYAGIECYSATLTIDGETISTVCLRPGFGIPLYSVIFDREGNVLEEATLVRYERP